MNKQMGSTSILLIVMAATLPRMLDSSKSVCQFTAFCEGISNYHWRFKQI